ncbi:hypothetical protein HDV03_003692 [Kappamyces sp. JEL0829]|nr:hypothetical protein HDV03_003692 [Kappamyces sp. JEL0829]
MAEPEFLVANPHAGTALESKHDYLSLILTARVYDVAIETPLQKAIHLSSKLGNTILFKREDLQPVFSFKCRGAHNKMAHLSKQERDTGNHAQGVALAASKMNLKATIVMPSGTPAIKWKNVARLGAQVVLHGNDFEDSKQECARLCKEKGFIDIPPYDDPLVIAGQGTIGVEILRQYDFTKIDAIFVCVGGGGLIAGIAAYVKRIYPKIKIVGVETYDADAMTRSLQKGERVTLSEVGLFADGAAVRTIGVETFRVCKALVDEMVLVSTDELCAAIKDVFEDTRAILEPAGALAVAGVKKYISAKGITGGTFVTTCSGANMNFDRLRFVAERAGFGENTEALLCVVIPEIPSSFLKLYRALDPRIVTEFSYRYGDDKEAHIFLSVMLKDHEKDLPEIFSKLQAQGMLPTNATRNELAKSHARYLVGGRMNVPNERIFRFEFPERPGALKRFLETLKPKWNVSLFHYRNYGGDMGRVMVGIQVPAESNDGFQEFLSTLKYPYVEETGNDVYQRFLK